MTPGVSIGTMKAEMPAMALRRIGLGEDDRPRGVAGVRDERLRAVQDVLVTAPHRGRLQTRDVRAGVRLREPERAEDRRLEQRRQPRRLLLVGAREDDRAGAEPVRADRRADSRAAPVELLADEHAVERRQARGRRSSSGTCRFISPTAWAFAITSAGMLRALVVLGGLRPDLLRRELARERAQFLLLVRQGERDAAHGLGRRHVTAS